VCSGSVALAAAAGARLSCPLPASRVSDTAAADDAVEGAGGGAWTTPITSHVWAGSALFFTTGTGELWYLTPRGAARRAAALEPWISDASLIAVLPDRAVFAVRHWAVSER
jgi:hypothetical protein